MPITCGGCNKAWMGNFTLNTHLHAIQSRVENYHSKEKPRLLTGHNYGHLLDRKETFFGPDRRAKEACINGVGGK